MEEPKPPWFAAPSVAAPGTHVLLVATSQYDNLPQDGSRGPLGLRQLTSAVLGVYRLGLWMRKNAEFFAPPIRSIRMAISPSDVEMREIRRLDASTDWLSPTRDNVKRLLLAWQETCQDQPNNVAILYIAGHGILSPRGSINVLLQDAFEDPDLDNAVRINSVQSALGMGRLAASLLFVDACQDLLPDNKYDMEGGVKLAPPANAQGDSRLARPVFTGSSPATQAYGEDGVGSFMSRALLECLQGRAARHTDATYTNWMVSTMDLSIQLGPRTAHYDARQRIEQFDVNTPFDFLRLPAPPRLPMTIRISPQKLASSARGSLSDYRGDLVPGVTLTWSVPTVLDGGSYVLSIHPGGPPPFAPKVLPLVNAPPEGVTQEVHLS